MKGSWDVFLFNTEKSTKGSVLTEKGYKLRMTRDEGRGTNYEGRETNDEGRGTNDEGRGTNDEGRGTNDEGWK